MRELKTGDKSFAITWAGLAKSLSNGRTQLVIDLQNETRRLTDVILDFDRQKTITVKGRTEMDAVEVYQGYSRVTAITAPGDTGHVRIYMEQED